MFNSEYRYLLFKQTWIGLQTVIFMDVGSWRNPGGQITDVPERDNLKYFMGGRASTYFPEAQQVMLRLDYGYGLNPAGINGFVVSLGQYL